MSDPSTLDPPPRLRLTPDIRSRSTFARWMRMASYSDAALLAPTAERMVCGWVCILSLTRIQIIRIES